MVHHNISLTTKDINMYSYELIFNLIKNFQIIMCIYIYIYLFIICLRPDNYLEVMMMLRDRWVCGDYCWKDQ